MTKSAMSILEDLNAVNRLLREASASVCDLCARGIEVESLGDRGYFHVLGRLGHTWVPCSAGKIQQIKKGK